jgi:tRNA (adenine22-N1)-methyltransferase
MILSPRLKAIANMVPKCRSAADIGTDHGYVPLYLIQNRRIEYAIAADISPGSLNKAKNLIQQHSMGHCMETRLGNGLSVLRPGEADTIIIAGMGGLLIGDILEQGEAVARKASTLVLQPMVAQEELRRWLISNNYCIKEEDLVREDKRIYEIIVVVPCTNPVKPERDIYYDIGWKLIQSQHPLLGDFIEKKIQSLEEIINQLQVGKSESVEKRMKELRDKLKQYKEVYNCHIR